MYRLVYMSRSTHPMSNQDLEKILAVARRKNAQRGVTGILLYAGEAFFQVLEGPKDEVEAVFDLVFGDERHSKVRRLFGRDVDERRFEDWSMGFAQLDEDDARAQGFFDLSKAELEDRIPEKAGDNLLKLLYGFAETKIAA